MAHTIKDKLYLL